MTHKKQMNTLEIKTSTVKIFVGENFRRQKFSSVKMFVLFSDEVFTDKVLSFMSLNMTKNMSKKSD